MGRHPYDALGKSLPVTMGVEQPDNHVPDSRKPVVKGQEGPSGATEGIRYASALREDGRKGQREQRKDKVESP